MIFEDKNKVIMHRDNNNLVSVQEVINELGESTVRLYYDVTKYNEVETFDKEILYELYNE